MSRWQLPDDVGSLWEEQTAPEEASRSNTGCLLAFPSEIPTNGDAMAPGRVGRTPAEFALLVFPSEANGDAISTPVLLVDSPVSKPRGNQSGFELNVPRSSIIYIEPVSQQSGPQDPLPTLDRRPLGGAAARRQVSLAMASGMDRALASIADLCRRARSLSERTTPSLRTMWNTLVRLVKALYAHGYPWIPLVRTGPLIGPGLRRALVSCVCVAAVGVTVAWLTPRVPYVKGLVMRTLMQQGPGTTATAARTPVSETPTTLAPRPPDAGSAASVQPPADASTATPDVRKAPLAEANRVLAAAPAVTTARNRRPGTSAQERVGSNPVDANVPRPRPATAQQPPPVPQYRGSLAVSSSPEGAAVFVNGVSVGPTPLVLLDIPVGSRVVRVDLNGYERWSAAVRIVANEQTRVTATLRPASIQ